MPEMETKTKRKKKKNNKKPNKKEEKGFYWRCEESTPNLLEAT
jgi:hypothetical protein